MWRTLANISAAGAEPFTSLPGETLRPNALRVRVRRIQINLRKPPSLNLSKFHKEYGGPRHVHTRIIQTITGHGFIGEYYSRFLPDIPAECPCETTDTQTRSHILTDCPLLEEHRHLLREASQDLSPAVILGTHKGLEALAKFITASNAFGKT